MIYSKTRIIQSTSNPKNEVGARVLLFADLPKIMAQDDRFILEKTDVSPGFTRYDGQVIVLSQSELLQIMEAAKKLPETLLTNEVLRILNS